MVPVCLDDRLHWMKKKILILTADAGYGHRSASNAIASSLDILHGDSCECRIANPVFEKSAPFFMRDSQINYDRTVLKSPFFYRLSYDASDSMPISTLVHYTMGVLLYKAMDDLLAEYQPDAVITTFHLYEAPVDAVIAIQHRRVPFFCVVTDLSQVHKLWFRHTPKKLFVGTEAIRENAVACGFPPERIVVSGIPVQPSIAQEKRSKAEIRRSLGWDETLPTLLVIGSRRVSHLVEDMQSINLSGLPIQLIVIAGGDETRYNQLVQVSWQVPAHIYNFVKNTSEMMLAADILVSKAGGLVLSEGLACGLPVILIDALPGQETGNVDYVCRNQAGVSVSSPEALIAVLRDWLGKDQEHLEFFTGNATRLGKPDAAFQIATIVWESVQEHLDPSKPTQSRRESNL